MDEMVKFLCVQRKRKKINPKKNQQQIWEKTKKMWKNELCSIVRQIFFLFFLYIILVKSKEYIVLRRRAFVIQTNARFSTNYMGKKYRGDEDDVNTHLNRTAVLCSLLITNILLFIFFDNIHEFSHNKWRVCVFFCSPLNA